MLTGKSQKCVSKMKVLARKPYLVIFIFTLVLIVFFDKVLHIENSFIRSGFAASFAAFLSPRKKKIKTQTGDKTQITWVFLKEPIFLD